MLTENPVVSNKFQTLLEIFNNSDPEDTEEVSDEIEENLDEAIKNVDDSSNGNVEEATLPQNRVQTNNSQDSQVRPGTSAQDDCLARQKVNEFSQNDDTPWNKRVNRKPFETLTKRQKYNRLKYLRNLVKFKEKSQRRSSLTSIPLLQNNPVASNHSPMQNVQNIRNFDQDSVQNFVESNFLTTTEENVQNFSESNFPSRLIVTPEEKGVVNNVMATSENVSVDSCSNFKNRLHQYCIDSNLNHNQINDLLGLLRTHGCFQNLPKDSRTLLKCDRHKISLTKIGNGVYWHIGLCSSLREHLLLLKNLPNVLELDLNTDGLSLSRSNPHTYWPIQYRVRNISEFKPLIAGIYKGPDKPCDINLFFKKFIAEYEDVKHQGGLLVKNKRIPLKFENFIADAPARALILNHICHNGTEPCSKCKVAGYKFENRVMVFPGINFEKRNDVDYEALNYEDHQKGPTPLFKLEISPTKAPFDIMHLVYLGLTVKHLEAWVCGKFGYGPKLSNLFSQELSRRYIYLNNYCPNDFVRRPRTLEKPSKLKATELRHFLLYASIVICQDILSEDYFIHLMYLVIAMRILCRNDVTEEQLLTAENCLKAYVKFAPNLYTLPFVSYNVHAVQHLADDARLCGNLESVSAFVYENNMPLFKKNIRNHPKPLQQFANRLREKQGIQHKQSIISSSNILKLSNEHKEGPVPLWLEAYSYKQFKKCERGNFSIIIDDRNNFCQIKEDRSLCKIENIFLVNDEVIVAVRKFGTTKDVFENPVKSSSVGIFECKNLSNELYMVLMTDVVCKCYQLPIWKNFSKKHESVMIKGEYTLCTLLHTEN
ncbi:hypothetical protein TKK_0013851 [Trichogramma kaykai]